MFGDRIESARRTIITENVKTEIDAGIMTLTLARADKKNALSNAMYSAMSDAARQGAGSGPGPHQAAGRLTEPHQGIDARHGQDPAKPTAVFASIMAIFGRNSAGDSLCPCLLMPVSETRVKKRSFLRATTSVNG
jgi:hypothetical protein